MLILSGDNVNRCSVKMVKRIQQYASCPFSKLSKSNCALTVVVQSEAKSISLKEKKNTFLMKMRCVMIGGIVSNRKDAGCSQS